MYSKDNCSQCVSAAQWLTSQGLPLQTLKLDIDFSRETLLSIFPRALPIPNFL
ncbi:glutaredoxin domain-containing protein [Vibrio sonorensis]|uniref:glutaredoxin domain-containing protein n=1 Tax=Vibrio sonorensis TaxID=1004316 RepID=UPI00316AEA7F